MSSLDIINWTVIEKIKRKNSLNFVYIVRVLGQGLNRESVTTAAV